MHVEPCQHQGCRRESCTGFWCQHCIEQEWPYVPLGDGHRWIVWKGVSPVPGKPGMFTGALNCPYRLWKVVKPSWRSNWLLSPLGAIKVGYGTHILAAFVSIRRCQLRYDLVLDSTSAVIPIAAFPRSKLPSKAQAQAWLQDVNTHFLEIEAFERQMRTRSTKGLRELQLPLHLADLGWAMHRQLRIKETRVQQLQSRLNRAMNHRLDTAEARIQRLRRCLYKAMRSALPQRLAVAECSLPWEQLVHHIEHLQQLLPRNGLMHYLDEGHLDPQRYRAHAELLLSLLSKLTPNRGFALLLKLLTTSDLAGQSQAEHFVFERLIEQLPHYSQEQREQIAEAVMNSSRSWSSELRRYLIKLMLGNEQVIRIHTAQKELRAQHYVERGLWLLSESGLLYRLQPGRLQAYVSRELKLPREHLVDLFLVVGLDLSTPPARAEVAYELALSLEPKPVYTALKHRTPQFTDLDAELIDDYALDWRLEQKLRKGEPLRVVKV